MIASRMTIVALVLPLVLGPVGLGRAEGFPGRAYSTYDDADEEDAEYYREYAQVSLGRERRLANGVSWRLLIGRRTGMAMPRITWMPDRSSRTAANARFDAIHGAAIRDADGIVRLWQTRCESDCDRLVAKNPKFYGHQYEIFLTYATARFVSYREFGDVYWDYRDSSLLNKGAVIDLREGTVFGVKACPGEERRYSEQTPEYDDPVPVIRDGEPRYNGPRHFVFGDLMHICDEALYVSFRALVVRHASLAVRNKRRTSWILDLLDDDRPMLPVLTPSGLGLYDFSRHGEGPLIIPYRELESFMKPGPLREELLSLVTPAR